MSYVIKAVLSNPQHPECGQITIPFPIPVDQYDQTIEMLQTMGLGESVERDCKVDEIDSCCGVLGALEGTLVNVDGLDYLAKRLDSLYTGMESHLPDQVRPDALAEPILPATLLFTKEQLAVIFDAAQNMTTLNLVSNPEQGKLLEGIMKQIEEAVPQVIDLANELTQIPGRHGPEEMQGNTAQFPGKKL